MYNNFFGLRKSPFNLTPDPEFLYMTVQHKEALASFTYGILARKGFVVLTGNAGTGKTTLLTQMLQNLPVARIQTSVIVNPTLTPAEFLESVLLDFGFEHVPSSKAQRISLLQRFLWRAHREGRISALIVDEAHKLSLEVLEEIRLLGNFESASQKLLQIVLVGQPELDTVLNSDSLRQFKQRIALRAVIQPFPVDKVGEYIQHRWTVAGGTAAPFSPAAIAGIAQASQGIPRVINAACDNSLLEAFGEESPTVELGHVMAACRDLQLALPAPPPAAAPPALPKPVVPAALPLVPRGEAPAMMTLQRYIKTPPEHPSLLTRLRTRLKLAQRIETA
jgi:general secretion pathway protein A